MAGNGYSLPPLDSPDEIEVEETSGQERTVVGGKRDGLILTLSSVSNVHTVHE